jgi:hypothetical protein
MAATDCLSWLWEDVYRHRSLFIRLYRHHLHEKIETALPEVVLLPWETFPVVCVCRITLDAEPLMHVPWRPKKALWLECPGRVAPCPCAALCGSPGGALLCLTRRAVTTPPPLGPSGTCLRGSAVPACQRTRRRAGRVHLGAVAHGYEHVSAGVMLRALFQQRPSLQKVRGVKALGAAAVDRYKAHRVPAPLLRRLRGP